MPREASSLMDRSENGAAWCASVLGVKRERRWRDGDRAWNAMRSSRSRSAGSQERSRVVDVHDACDVHAALRRGSYRGSLAVAFEGRTQRSVSGLCSANRCVAGRVREPQSCPLVARSLKPAAHSTTVCATTTPMSDGMLVVRCPGGARRSASMGMDSWRGWRESPRAR